MISRLYIKNLAVVRELEVTFHEGLNIISGETGSGKSMLIEALSLLLGGRVSSEIVRTGEKAAVVEGELKTGSDTWLVRRVIRVGGASRIFLNDEPVKLATLEERIAPLVDLHGQHEHQSLLRVATHLEFLDAYAGLSAERQQLAGTYQRLIEVRDAYQQLKADLHRDRDQYQLRQFQLNELQEAQMAPDEEEALTREQRLLSQAGELSALLRVLQERLQLADSSITGELGGLQKQLGQFAPLAPELGELAARMSSLNLELADLAYELQRFGDTVKVNPARLAEVDERLGVLEGIKRKYGGSLAAALDHQAQLLNQISAYSAGDERLARLKGELSELQGAYAQQCRELSRSRGAARDRLAGDIVRSLAALDMPKARFEVRTENIAQEGGLCVLDGQAYKSDQRGYDQVEFYLSPNPGEDLRPLARIASGGEVSRIMLGIKTVLAAFDPVGTLIFDEIDSGISGSTAETVGTALERLAEKRQVICITHLAQIASRGDHHIIMSKSVENGRTVSRSQAITGEGRRREVARLLSGAEITSASLDQARLLLAGRRSEEVLAGHG